jgi:hypothetical protein
MQLYKTLTDRSNRLGNVMVTMRYSACDVMKFTQTTNRTAWFLGVLTMVCNNTQDYWVLGPFSIVWYSKNTKEQNVSETGSISVLKC